MLIMKNIIKYPSKTLVFLQLVFFMSVILPVSTYSCTVVVASNAQCVLAGANEDWSDPNTSFTIYPPTDSTFGWIKLGFEGYTIELIYSLQEVQH